MSGAWSGGFGAVHWGPSGLENDIDEIEDHDEMRNLIETSLAQNEEVKKISAWAAILFAPTLVGTI